MLGSGALWDPWPRFDPAEPAANSNKLQGLWTTPSVGEHFLLTGLEQFENQRIVLGADVALAANVFTTVLSTLAVLLPPVNHRGSWLIQIFGGITFTVAGGASTATVRLTGVGFDDFDQDIRFAAAGDRQAASPYMHGLFVEGSTVPAVSLRVRPGGAGITGTAFQNSTQAISATRLYLVGTPI